MKILRKIISWLLKSIAGILFLVFLYIFVAIILTIIPVNGDFKEGVSGTDIFISSNGVHTNIIIPSSSSQYGWTEKLAFDKSIKYLAFGWGDKEFYMNTPNWSDLKFSTAFKAVFLPTPSIIQVYGLKKNPEISKNTIKIRLSDQQIQLISEYIYGSFIYIDKDYPIEIYADTKGGFYRYFKSKGKYSLFFTCNNWVNRGLKKAGVKNSVWAPFDKSVLYYLD